MPSAESLASNRLDGPPPPPSGVVRRVPDTPAPAGQMMGGPQNDPSTLPALLIQRSMSLEEVLDAFSQAHPEQAPMVAAARDSLRSSIAPLVQGAQQGSQPSPQGVAGIMAQPTATPGSPQAPPAPLPAAGAA